MMTFFNILFLTLQVSLYFILLYLMSDTSIKTLKIHYILIGTVIFYLFGKIDTLLSSIIITIYLVLYSHKKITDSFSLSFFYSLFIILSNILLGNALELSTSKFYNMDSVLFLIIHLLSYSIFPFGIILLSFRLFNIPKSFFKLKSEFIQNKIIKILNPIMVLFLLLIPLTFYAEILLSKNNTIPFTKYIVFILFFMYFILIAFLKVQLDKYQQLQIQKEKEEQLAHLNLYVTEIEELYQTVRGFRHDYGNILVSMRESIYHGSPDEIKQTYEDILKKSHLQLENHNYHYAELANVKDIPLKSILVSKLLTIEKLEIPFTLEVKHKVHFHQTDILEVVRILSILIDNAIDEVKSSSEQSNGKIRLALINGNEQIIVIIENTVAQRKILPQSEQLGTLGYSTKGAGRGTGLFNLTKIIEGHPEIAIETKIEPEWFSQILTFENKAVE